MKKKIAIICDYILKPERIGGMDRFYKLYDNELRNEGYQVDWYFTNFEPFDFFKDLKIYSAKGKPVERFFIETTKKKNKEYQLIITHFTSLCTVFYKEFNKLLPQAKIIAVDHNPRPLKGFSFKKRLKKKIQGLLYSKYIHQFIGVSQYTVNHILKDYGNFLKKKTKVIYNGIDINVFKKRTKENKNKFIVASHLRKSKGVQDLLKALSLLQKSKLNKVKIDIYGNGPYQSVLKKLTTDYNLNNIVSFKGSSSNLHQLFSEYSYMVQPTYMECFSLSILESLSANVPVITTTVGGNLEVLTDNKNSYIYSPGDYTALAKILDAIISEKKKISLDTSTIVVEKFYLEKMVEDHINIIKCI